MIAAAIALLALVIVTAWMGGPTEMIKAHNRAMRRMERQNED